MCHGVVEMFRLHYLADVCSFVLIRSIPLENCKQATWLYRAYAFLTPILNRDSCRSKVESNYLDISILRQAYITANNYELKS
jgi:hypothetical protein